MENTNTNIETVIAEAKADLEAKNFTTITIENSGWDNTIRARLNRDKHRINNGYGPSKAQIEYLGSFKNVGHWDPQSGKSDWYSRSYLYSCSKCAISWLINFAKKHRSIDIDVVIEK